MKAIAFTLDALLALVIAAAAISVLLYFQFYPETAYVIKSAEAQSTLSLLLSTNVSSLANSTGIISAIIGQQGSADQVWTQYQGRASRAGSQPGGPLTSFVSNTITVNAPITIGIAADYGNIYFASGSTLYAFNATGYQVWSVDTGANVETLPVLVDGKVIYWNSQGMSAVSAFNGSAIWTDSAFAAATPSAPMIAYDGELIAFADGNVYSVYQNNGTVWSATALGTTVVTAAIGGGGSLALGTAANTINLLTNINNVGSQGVIWASGTPVTPAGLLSYDNVLAIFGGQYAVEQDINSTSIGFISTGATVSGDAVSGTGTVVYQVSNEVMALATNGITLWTKQIPAAPYGSALAGSSPVIGGGSVYSLWSNNYLIAENTSTGSIKWSTRLPYSGLLPNMTLAYGRLYVTAGNSIMAYGSCDVSPRLTVLQAVATLYMNGDGSCADYMLNNLKPLNNYSVMSGNAFLPGTSLAHFGGTGSYAATGGGYPALGTLTLSFWADPSGSTGSQQLMIDSSPQGMWTVGFTPGNLLFFSPGTGTVVDTQNSISFDRWQFLTLTAEDSFSNTLYAMYINGIKVSSGNVVGESIGAVNGLTFSSSEGWYNGVLANVQLYSSVLNASQIGLLYQGGVQGGPDSNAGLLSWFPLDGDMNDYGNQSNTAYAFNVVYGSANYMPQGLTDAYEIGTAKAVVPVLNYSTQYEKLYNIGVEAWK